MLAVVLHKKCYDLLWKLYFLFTVIIENNALWFICNVKFRDYHFQIYTAQNESALIFFPLFYFVLNKCDYKNYKNYLKYSVPLLWIFSPLPSQLVTVEQCRYEHCKLYICEASVWPFCMKIMDDSLWNVITYYTQWKECWHYWMWNLESTV